MNNGNGRIPQPADELPSEAPPPNEPLSDGRPDTIAAAFLHATGRAEVDWYMNRQTKAVHISAVRPTRLRHWREEFYEFRDCVYRRIDREDLTSELVKFVNRTWCLGAGAENRRADNRGSAISNAMMQLRAICQAGCQQMPAWLTDKPRPEPDDVLSFQNGILSVRNWLEDPDCALLPPSPLWFSESVLPCEWSPEARCPRWLQFLDEALGDAELIGLVQEWFGYSLTSSTRFQKMLWLHGVSGAGKGTLTTMLEKVVGEENCASFELWDLIGRFTLSQFLGKRLAISADAALGHGTDADKVLAKLKGISGEGGQMIDRKNREMLNQRLKIRFVISTNEFPNLPDAADAMARRAMFVPFDRTFQGAEDPHLVDAMTHEVPGITLWALHGLVRLLRRGRFSETVASKRVTDEFKRLQSPVHAFVQDCCVQLEYDPITRAGRVDPDALHGAFKRWAAANERKVMSKDRFFCKFKAIARWANRVRPTDDDNSRYYEYRGIELREEWQTKIPV